MAVAYVIDRFFDITLSSNSFQERFPDNTVSAFRAKLPVTLIFPPNSSYKVGLHKLTFINSINNIGKGANTKLWISTATKNPDDIFFPDISIEDIETFIHFLGGQLKKAVPQYFVDEIYAPVSIAHTDHVLHALYGRNNVNLNDILADEGDLYTVQHDDSQEIAQADEPISDTSNEQQLEADEFKIKLQSDVDRIEPIRNSIFKIIFSEAFSSNSHQYFKLAAHFKTIYFPIIYQFENKVEKNKTSWNSFANNNLLPPWPFTQLQKQIKWIIQFTEKHIIPYESVPIFPETAESIERYNAMKNDIEQQRNKFTIDDPEFAKTWQNEQEIKNDVQLFSNLLNVDLNTITTENDNEKVFVDFLKDEIETHLFLRFHESKQEIETLTVALQELWTKGDPSVIETLVSNYIDVSNWMSSIETSKDQTIINAIQQQWESGQNELKRPKELTILNPLTDKIFATVDEFNQFRMRTYTNVMY